MTDKEFMKRVTKEALRRQAAKPAKGMRSTNFVSSPHSAQEIIEWKRQRGLRPSTLFHRTSFEKGAMYALEMLKAERLQRKIMNE